MEAAKKIQFLLGSEARCLDAVPPTQTVLEYLRNVERMTGTKEGCAEGDCGACTVVLAESDNGRLRYRAVNSCIMFVPALHGKQLIAVEHLKPRQENGLHPVQRAMVDEHGSQCGFCTPGFVMSMFAMMHNRRTAQRDTIDDALAGNLCRCTGYAPIIRAAKKVLGAPRPVADEFDRHESETIAKLNRIDRQSMLEMRNNGAKFYAPRTCDQLARILHREPDACMVAGATDVGLWVTKKKRRLNPVVYLSGIESMRTISRSSKSVRIGAMVSVADAMPALSGAYPSLDEFYRRFGSEQIRNSATIGGNVANGSPIGDSMPALIAVGAQLHLASLQGVRSLPMEDFFIAYGKQDLRRGEFLQHMDVPLPKQGEQLRAYKISKRYHQDISAVCGAFFAKIEDRVIQKIRIAFGGMDAIPRRAKRCESFLINKRFDEATVELAMEVLQEEFAPLTDFRASDAYRSQVTANLLRRYYLDVTQRCPVNVWKTTYA